MAGSRGTIARRMRRRLWSGWCAPWMQRGGGAWGVAKGEGLLLLLLLLLLRAAVAVVVQQ